MNRGICGARLIGGLLIGLFLASGHPAQVQPAPNAIKLRTLGDGAILDYAWADDGQTLVLDMPDSFRIYHAGQADPLIIEKTYRADDLLLSPDGSILIESHVEDIYNRHLVLWNTASGELIARHDFSERTRLSGFTFFAGRAVLGFLNATFYEGVSTDSGVWLWYYRTDEEPYIVHIPANLVIPGQTAAFNADQSLIGITYGSSQNGSGSPIAYLQIYDAVSGDEISVSIEVRPYFDTLLFSPTDAHLLASLDTRGTVRLWDASTGTELRALTLSQDIVTDMVFSADGTQLITNGTDGKVRVWDVATGALLEVYADQPQAVTRLHALPDGTILAFGSPWQNARAWDVRTGATVAQFDVQPVTPGLGALVFNAAGDRIIARAGYDTVLAWDLAFGDEITLLVDERVAAGTTLFSPDGALLANLNNETGELTIWNLVSGGVPATAHFAPFDSEMVEMVFAPDGSAIRALFVEHWRVADYCERMGDDHIIRVLEWRLTADGQPGPDSVLYETTRPYFVGLTLSPVDPLVCFISTGGPVAQSFDGDATALPLEGDSFYDLQFSPHGTLLIAGDSDYLRVIDWQTQAITQEFRWQFGEYDVQQAVFAHDETLIALATENRVTVTELATNRTLLADASHIGKISGMAFSPDGSLFAAGSNDGTVIVWRLE